MKKSHFNKKQLGHFCMGFEEYTFFTSPIRRYVDMIVHRLIKSSLKQEKNNFDIDIDKINDKKVNPNQPAIIEWIKDIYDRSADFGVQEQRAVFNILQEKNLDPQNYFLIPVHAWQWHQWLVPTYANEIVDQKIIELNISQDSYVPMQSIRTLCNTSNLQRHYIKLPVSIFIKTYCLSLKR